MKNLVRSFGTVTAALLLLAAQVLGANIQVHTSLDSRSDLLCVVGHDLSVIWSSPPGTSNYSVTFDYGNHQDIMATNLEVQSFGFSTFTPAFDPEGNVFHVVVEGSQGEEKIRGDSGGIHIVRKSPNFVANLLSRSGDRYGAQTIIPQSGAYFGIGTVELTSIELGTLYMSSLPIVLRGPSNILGSIRSLLIRSPDAVYRQPFALVAPTLANLTNGLGVWSLQTQVTLSDLGYPVSRKGAGSPGLEYSLTDRFVQDRIISMHPGLNGRDLLNAHNRVVADLYRSTNQISVARMHPVVGEKVLPFDTVYLEVYVELTTTDVSNLSGVLELSLAHVQVPGSVIGYFYDANGAAQWAVPLYGFGRVRTFFLPTSARPAMLSPVVDPRSPNEVIISGYYHPGSSIIAIQRSLDGVHWGGGWEYTSLRVRNGFFQFTFTHGPDQPFGMFRFQEFR